MSHFEVVVVILLIGIFASVIALINRIEELTELVAKSDIDDEGWW